MNLSSVAIALRGIVANTALINPRLISPFSSLGRLGSPLKASIKSLKNP